MALIQLAVVGDVGHSLIIDIQQSTGVSTPHWFQCCAGSFAYHL